ncbi:Superoxide dismutase [Mn] [Kluyvera cryocrescens]|uniref:superoxide dismutase n=1 Tax=Kluyvera cryocrescens TaxID=580 RepID=A0A485B6Y3_KLUCR|nr:Superoxide dismutase [Mn] [Kluyvera cryocrescens]
MRTMPWNATSTNQTMEIHHSKHHQAYVNNANAALESLPEFASLSAEELIAKTGSAAGLIRKTVLRNNAGGHANHSFFWKGLKKRHHPAG